MRVTAARVVVGKLEGERCERAAVSAWRFLSRLFACILPFAASALASSSYSSVTVQASMPVVASFPSPLPYLWVRISNESSKRLRPLPLSVGPLAQQSAFIRQFFKIQKGQTVAALV